MAEEILIDGVDVSGCYFAEISKTGSVACSQIDIRDCEGDIDLLLADCDEHPDCSYKQLQRLEQERDELKKNYKEDHAELLMARSEIESLKSNLEEFARRADFAGKENDKLEQENKELKAELNKVIDEREKKIEETLLKGCYQSLGSECRIYELKESKYRSALEEIRTYLNTLSSIDNDFPNTETYLRIQNKISEVLECK